MLNTLRYLFSHPLTQHNKIGALRRFFSWQIGSRLIPYAVAVPFINETRLLVSNGMTGATGNIYCGLHEFEDMALVLHSLRPGDLFVDVGANIGSYTVLAGGVAGARCLSIEPIPSTFHLLEDNLRLNRLESLVCAKNLGVGAEAGLIGFTYDQDTMNHIAIDGDDSHTITIPVHPLDEILEDKAPTLIKIDVEGFETAVITGASKALRSPSLLAVLMELNGCGARYGFDERDLHNKMIALGFRPFRYIPFSRELRPLEDMNLIGDNTLYVKDINRLVGRICAAPKFHVLDSTL